MVGTVGKGNSNAVRVLLVVLPSAATIGCTDAAVRYRPTMMGCVRAVLQRSSTLIVVSAVLACGDPPSPSQVTVRDSAGIRIVEHGPLADIDAFRVGEPVYHFGWSDTDHIFGRVTSGVLLSDGRAAVGDSGSDEIILLTGDGTVEAVLGGSGQGPEEIGSLISLSRLAGDTLVLEDLGNARISFIHAGEWVRSYPRGVASLLMGVGVQERSLLIMSAGYPLYFEEPWYQGVIAKHPLETQRLDTVRMFDFASRVIQGETPNPLRATGSIGVTAGAVLIARGDRAQVEAVDLDGRTTQIVRWTEQDRPVTDDFWAAYAERRRGTNSRLSEAELRTQLAELRAAADEPLPYLSYVRGDPVGRVWVSEYSADFRHPERYRVFDRDGDWLGWVSLPPRVEILDIGSDMILAIQRNEFDVDAVTLLPLHGGGTPQP